MPRPQKPKRGAQQTLKKHSQTPPQAPAQQLYLVLTASAHEPDLCALVQRAQTCGPIGCVLLEGDNLTPPALLDLGPAIKLLHGRGIATLLRKDVGLAQSLHADGVHFSADDILAEEFSKLRHSLGKDFILGAEAGGSRHTAMCLGENGADYIAFGKNTNTKEPGNAFEAQRDLLLWWSQLFEVPSVAFDITSPTEARVLLDSGADFIAIKVPQEKTSTMVSEFLSPYFALLES